MPPAEQPISPRPAIPPPPSQNENIVKALAKHIITILEKRIFEGDLTISEIADTLGKIHSVKDLQKIASIVSNEILCAVYEFCEDRETASCIPAALEEVKLHFCAHSGHIEEDDLVPAERSVLTDFEKANMLKEELEDFIRNAIAKGMISRAEATDCFGQIFSLKDVKCGQDTPITMQAVHSICKKFMELHGDGYMIEDDDRHYVDIALFKIKVAITTEALW